MWTSTIWATIADDPSDGDWTYDTTAAGVPWQNDKRYNVSVRITDMAGNETGQSGAGDPDGGDGSAFYSFVYDIGAPASVITYPAAGGTVNVGYELAGSSSDAKASVAYVEYVLEDQGDAGNRYWNGTTW